MKSMRRLRIAVGMFGCILAGALWSAAGRSEPGSPRFSLVLDGAAVKDHHT